MYKKAKENTAEKAVKRHVWVKWTALVACLAIIVTGVLYVPKLFEKQTDVPGTTESEGTTEDCAILGKRFDSFDDFLAYTENPLEKDIYYHLTVSDIINFDSIIPNSDIKEIDVYAFGYFIRYNYDTNIDIEGTSYQPFEIAVMPIYDDYSPLESLVMQYSSYADPNFYDRWSDPNIQFEYHYTSLNAELETIRSIYYTIGGYDMIIDYRHTRNNSIMGDKREADGVFILMENNIIYIRGLRGVPTTAFTPAFVTEYGASDDTVIAMLDKIKALIPKE